MEIVAVTSHFVSRGQLCPVPMCCQAVVTPNVGSINEALDGASNICFMLLGYMGIGCDGKRCIAVYSG